MKTAIIGSGGHARSVAGVVIEELNISVFAFFDVGGTQTSEEKIYGIPVLPGKVDLAKNLRQAGVDSLILAVGDNKARSDYFSELKKDFTFPNIISKSAVIKSTVKMGVGNIIFPFAYIGPYSILGDNNIINTRSTIEHECEIGSSNHVSPASILLGRVKVGDFNFIGAGAAVIPNLRIKNEVILGANSTAIWDLMDEGVYIGSPAKLKGNS